MRRPRGVLSRAGRYQKVKDNLEVKEVLVGDRRYVVCRNPVEARKDKAAREALLEQLQRTISEKGPKAVIGNRGYARFVHIAKGSVTINQEAVETDARLDGKFVLTTNTDMPAPEVALTYKSLWRVERTFREQKTTLKSGPSIISVTTPLSATSLPVSSPYAWKWICSDVWMREGSRSHGRILCEIWPASSRFSWIAKEPAINSVPPCKDRHSTPSTLQESGPLSSPHHPTLFQLLISPRTREHHCSANERKRLMYFAYIT